MMQYINIAESNIITLNNFKTYAKIVGINEDELLLNILKDAATRIQEYSDTALLACTIKQQAIGTIIRLFQKPISAVTSVIDLFTGENVDYIPSADFSTLKIYSGKEVIITYTTSPIDAQVERMALFVYEMASAIYDGNTEEQNKVYQRIPI